MTAPKQNADAPGAADERIDQMLDRLITAGAKKEAAEHAASCCNAHALADVVKAAIREALLPWIERLEDEFAEYAICELHATEGVTIPARAGHLSVDDEARAEFYRELAAIDHAAMLGFNIGVPGVLIALDLDGKVENRADEYFSRLAAALTKILAWTLDAALANSLLARCKLWAARGATGELLDARADDLMVFLEERAELRERRGDDGLDLAAPAFRNELAKEVVDAAFATAHESIDAARAQHRAQHGDGDAAKRLH